MFSWLKAPVQAVTVILAALLAFMAAQRVQQHRDAQRRWEEIAQENKDVTGHVVNAKQALSQAKLHAAEAERVKRIAERRLDRVANSNDTIADIVDRWRR